MKEKLALTDIRKYKNRMSFGPEVFILSLFNREKIVGTKRISRNRAWVWYDRGRNRQSEITAKK